MEINQSHFLKKLKINQVKDKVKGKNNTKLIILFVLIFIFIGMFYFIFNLSNEEANIDTNKQEKQIDNNVTSSYIPPMPVVEIENEIKEKNTTIENKNIFNFQAIEDKKNEPVAVKKEVIELQEINKNDKQIDTEKQLNNKNNVIENNFALIRKEANIKTNFFKFRGKNFYEGDILLDFKILEVTDSKITLKTKNNEIKEIYK